VISTPDPTQEFTVQRGKGRARDLNLSYKGDGYKVPPKEVGESAIPGLVGESNKKCNLNWISKDVWVGERGEKQSGSVT
jgi:hypothetical protein